MTMQTINLGTTANDGTGDTLRDAGDKINDNFTELYAAVAASGASWKAPVRVATTAAGTLATGFENGDTVDGVTLATGDRILIKNQSTGAENGIYVVAASGVPTRAADADTGAELLGAGVFVSEGTANADTLWTCTTNAPITLGTTALAFSQYAGGGAVAGAIGSSGLTMSTARLLGRTTGSTGAVEEISVGAGLTLSGGSLSASGGGGGDLALISEVVTSSSATDVTFSSIATTWRDLEIRVRGRGSSAAGWVGLLLQLNGDTASNYRRAQWASNSQSQSGAESSSSATSYLAGYIPDNSALSGAAGAVTAHILNYKDTTWHKMFLSEAVWMTGTSASSYNQGHAGGTWISTAAVTAVKVFLASGNFVNGTVISLYGRK